MDELITATGTRLDMIARDRYRIVRVQSETDDELRRRIDAFEHADDVVIGRDATGALLRTCGNNEFIIRKIRTAVNRAAYAWRVETLSDELAASVVGYSLAFGEWPTSVPMPGQAAGMIINHMVDLGVITLLKRTNLRTKVLETWVEVDLGSLDAWEAAMLLQLQEVDGG